MYRISRIVCVTVLSTWNRLRVEGREQVPRQGGALLLANHQSFLDIPVVAAATPRHVAFVARESLAESRFLAWLMRGCGAILIRLGSADRAALSAMIERLVAGDCGAVFPEGTRSRDGSLGKFRAGAVFAARRARVPIVPVGIRGAIQALPRDVVLPRPRRIGVRFGTPLAPASPDALGQARGAIAAMIGDGSFGAVPQGP